MPEPLTDIHSAVFETVRALRNAHLAVDATKTLGTLTVQVAEPLVPDAFGYRGQSARTADATNEGDLSSDIVATDDQGHDVVSVIHMPSRGHWHLVVIPGEGRSWDLHVEPLEYAPR
jgi:hypothetical protein